MVTYGVITNNYLISLCKKIDRFLARHSLEVLKLRGEYQRKGSFHKWLVQVSSPLTISLHITICYAFEYI
jgi:hypothetical protein